MLPDSTYDLWTTLENLNWFPPKIFMGGMQFSIPNLYFKIQIYAMAPVIFFEKDFSRIFSDIHGYGTVFLNRIRQRQWYELVYENTDLDAYIAQT